MGGPGVGREKGRRGPAGRTLAPGGLGDQVGCWGLNPAQPQAGPERPSLLPRPSSDLFVHTGSCWVHHWCAAWSAGVWGHEGAELCGVDKAIFSGISQVGRRRALKPGSGQAGGRDGPRPVAWRDLGATEAALPLGSAAPTAPGSGPPSPAARPDAHGFTTSPVRPPAAPSCP